MVEWPEVERYRQNDPENPGGNRILLRLTCNQTSVDLAVERERAEVSGLITPHLHRCVVVCVDLGESLFDGYTRVTQHAI